MSTTTILAITGIVTSGIVGPTVAALWVARQQGRKQSFERATIDLSGLRAVIDEASAALAALSASFLKVLDARLRGDRDDGHLWDEFQSRQVDSYTVGQRLSILLGRTHPLAKAFWAWRNEFDDFTLLKTEPLPREGLTAEKVRDFVRQSYLRGTQAGVKAGRFTDEARRLIGAKLEDLSLPSVDAIDRDDDPEHNGGGQQAATSR